MGAADGVDCVGERTERQLPEGAGDTALGNTDLAAALVELGRSTRDCRLIYSDLLILQVGNRDLE